MFASLPGRRGAVVPAAMIVLLSSARAAAHIDLLEPEARAHGTAARGDTQVDENSNLKSGPCGQVTSGRSARVATYEPGQTITVHVREENAHVSYLRVALALDGESFPLRSEVPAAAETQEEASAAEAALGDFGLLAVLRENNDTPGFVHEIEVTLPEVTCQRCTLQVLQFMYDDRAAPYYFQCADLVIADAGVAPDAGPVAPGAAGDSNGGAGGTSPATQTPTPSDRVAGTAPPGTLPAVESRTEDAASGAAAAPRGMTAAAAPAMSESASDGGCSLSAGAAGPGAAERQRSFLGALLALGLALWCRGWRRPAAPIF